MQQKAFAAWKIIVLVCVILAVIAGGYLGLAWVLRKVNNAGTSSTATKSGSNYDQKLMGTWVSGCLVPDPNSPWSEKHQFIFQSNGTAVHTRWSNDTMAHNCSPSGTVGTLVNNYKFTIPASGQINLADQEAGQTYYDIYQISGTTLLFGHGFRGDNSTYASRTGASESDRIDSLNNYIAYTKQ